MHPSSLTEPSVLRVPSKLVCSPIRLSTSTLSTTGLRGRRVVGKPTLTSAEDERKLGPDTPWAGVVTPAAGAAPTIVSFGSGVTGTVAASSRSFDDSAPRNRVHSCSSDFLNIWLLLEGLTRNTPIVLRGSIGPSARAWQAAKRTSMS